MLFRSNAPNPEIVDDVMLNRQRISRIFYLKAFFDYPLSLSLKTFLNLGFIRTLKVSLSYIKTILFPIKNEKNLEDFFVNRFGKELYLTFFKDYTEKLWGINCSDISPEWGAQRIKGISIKKIIKDIVMKSLFLSHKKQIETSLIDNFTYPKLGCGQLWEKMAKLIEEKNGTINLGEKVIEINVENKNIVSVKTLNQNGLTRI